MKVDLPEPFGPVRPYRRPDKKAVDTSSKRIFAPTLSRAPPACPTACIPASTGQGFLPPRFPLSATGALMVLLHADHPPAGATTLIVSLGIISKPKALVMIEVAVFLLVAQALVINRLAGLPYPFWKYNPKPNPQ